MQQGGNTIELPWPGRVLSPNGRAHWRTVSKAKKAAKNTAYVLTKAARIGIAAGDVPVLIGLTFHPMTRNAVDADNLVASCKAFLDGIALALGVDDSTFKLAAPVIAEPTKGGRVVVTIT